MWRTRPCDRRDPGTGNSATNSKLPRPSIKAASDHAGPLRTPFPSRRLRFLKPRQVVVCLVEPRSNRIARETRRLPPRTLEFSCRPPRKSSRPSERLQKTRYATSRNPRNRAAILAVPRLSLLCASGIASQPSNSPKFSKRLAIQDQNLIFSLIGNIEVLLSGIRRESKGGHRAPSLFT
jgi:hypothetical protein